MHAAARQLERSVRAVADFGLDPRTYASAAVESFAGSADANVSAAARALLDVELTDLLITMLQHAARGHLAPDELHTGWSAAPRAFDPVETLAHLAAGDVLAALDRAQPQHDEYRRLRNALVRYRSMESAGGWRSPDVTPRLAPGDSADAVLALRARLAVEGFLPISTSPRLDSALAESVRTFQRTRGLEPDGIVGPRTWRALSTPAGELAGRIALNLERLRWEDRSADPARIEVRIPAFELRLVEPGEAPLVMRVIAGRPDWPTPVFDAVLTHAIFSPYWNVPPGITAQEVLPAVRRDVRYLERNELRVVTATGRVIDAATINWNAVGAATFPYRFRQDPGPRNPLGGVKFLLPNRYHVFLHDTPGRTAFLQADRALSHGCIRIEEPVLLAERLLAGAGAWRSPEIVKAMHAGVERVVAVPRRIPVIVRYETAWVGADGLVHFRDDIYGHDRRMQLLMEQRLVNDERLEPSAFAGMARRAANGACKA